MSKPYKKPQSAAKAKAPRSYPVEAPSGRTRPAKPAVSSQSTTQADSFSGVRISRRAADRVRAGHPWVYVSDVEDISTGQSGETPALLPVADNRGLLLGTALYSPSSQIALRMISSEALDEAHWLELMKTRLQTAISRRLSMMNEDTNACRLIFSEADELPGIVADKYGELIVLQLLTKGMDSPQVRKTCTAVLRGELAPETILERPDPRMRELEGLSAPSTTPLWSATPKNPLTHATFHLNGLKFFYDANAGQKTGAFLDQRLNYAAAAQYARRMQANSRALDVCTYQGGFALHLARVCERVTGIDASRASLEVAERNLETNRDRISAAVDWVEADAFEILRDWSDARKSFDSIVLDPPAFAKSRRAVEGALRGYKELNLRALKMIRPGGLLITCSCSHHVSLTDLEGAVASAAADAHRRVRLLERRGAAPDHPVVLNIPETEYLKCVVLEVE